LKKERLKTPADNNQVFVVCAELAKHSQWKPG